jgi:hypothetical protein
MLVKNGQTDVTTYFVLRDSTNHAPKTDVTVTDIDLYYVEELAAISAKADATALDAANSAHADNKAFHVGQGMYRIDWPDAAFDGGIGKKVQLIVVCSGVDTTFLEVELSAPVDSVAISGDATAADNAELMFDGTGYAGGTTKLGVDMVAISGDSTAADNLEAACDGNTYNVGGGAVVAASVTAEVSADVVKISGDSTAADRLEAMLDAMPSGAVVDDNDPDPSTTAFETNLSEATNDHYNGAFVVFTSGALLGQSRKISDYDGTTKVVTVATAFTEAPAGADTFIIIGRSE